MSDDNHTAPAVYHELVRFAGYRFGDDGSAWSRWEKVQGPSDPHLRWIIGTRWKRLFDKSIGLGKHRATSLKDSEAGRMVTMLIHRLVLEAFVGPCPPGMECRHLNGDPADNRLANLAWGTPTENAHDRIRHGTDLSGERNRHAKLDWDRVRLIRRAAKRGVSGKSLAKMLGVTPSLVSMIANGRIWRPRHCRPGFTSS